jgi:4-hydroxyproline epimerase
MKRIAVIDSHTGGEPTRVVISGGPDLGTGTLQERLDRFRTKHDAYRAAIVQEPRGAEVWVGALLVEPTDPECIAGVIFFNNVGYLGMCGHGTIGLMATLAHLGRIQPGRYKIETVVGVVTAELENDGQVAVTNVVSYRKAAGIRVEIPGVGVVTGDVAWSGNWFFLVNHPVQPTSPWNDLPLTPDSVEALTEYSWKIRQAINQQGFPEVDHVELVSSGLTPGADARNFVLCPGKAWDRSPCGTGTSAKLACLAADGKLAEGERWVQESLIGSRFIATYQRVGDQILPTIRGSAHIIAESTLLLSDNDPFQWGLPND